MKKILRLVPLVFGLFVAIPAYAHEAYVLDKNYFWQQLATRFSLHAFDALHTGHNLEVTLVIALSVAIVLFLNFLFRRTRIATHLGKWVEKFAKYGPLIVRLSIAVAFFYSAKSMSFLGPELPLSSFPWPALMQGILYAASALIAVGFLTEIAALVVLISFIGGFFIFGGYLLTYLNYLGELVVLFLFGMRAWSIDQKIFKRPLLFPKLAREYEHYETTIVRVLYGLALIYAAVTVKLLHPDLTLTVVKEWHLTQFHWLFPSDPLLVTFGAGVAEIVIGLFILLGFELRLTVFISLFYITLSLLYFRELVWPHLMLYGISLNLIVQPEIFSLDHILFERHRKERPWWHRPLVPHRKKRPTPEVA